MFLVSDLLALKAFNKSSRYIGLLWVKFSLRRPLLFSLYTCLLIVRNCKIEVYSYLLYFFQYENYLSLSDMKILKIPFGILVISCFIASSIKFLLFISLDLTVHLICSFNHINRNPLFVIAP